MRKLGSFQKLEDHNEALEAQEKKKLSTSSSSQGGVHQTFPWIIEGFILWVLFKEKRQENEGEDGDERMQEVGKIFLFQLFREILVPWIFEMSAKFGGGRRNNAPALFCLFYNKKR